MKTSEYLYETKPLKPYQRKEEEREYGKDIKRNFMH